MTCTKQANIRALGGSYRIGIFWPYRLQGDTRSKHSDPYIASFYLSPNHVSVEP